MLPETIFLTCLVSYNGSSVIFNVHDPKPLLASRLAAAAAALANVRHLQEWHHGEKPPLHCEMHNAWMLLSVGRSYTRLAAVGAVFHMPPVHFADMRGSTSLDWHCITKMAAYGWQRHPCCSYLRPQ